MKRWNRLNRCLGAGFFLAFAFASAALFAQERPVVFVSIPPQAWLVERLAGDAVTVETLLTPGANPHTFEPTARQMKTLASASLYLTLGLPFETVFVTRMAQVNPALRVTGMDTGVVKLGEAHHHADEAGAADHDDCDAHGDPHIWLSPRLMGAMASNTVAALAALMPRQRETLEQRRAETLALIGSVDADVRSSLQAVKPRTWVAYHPSWRYFAAEYGLTLLTLEADGKTPSARHLAEVVGRARAAGVRVVFAEPQYDRRPAQAVAEQLGARVETADPLQRDWPALMRGVAEKLAAKRQP